jgi:hypothetical protein
MVEKNKHQWLFGLLLAADLYTTTVVLLLEVLPRIQDAYLVRRCSDLLDHLSLYLSIDLTLWLSLISNRHL